MNPQWQAHATEWPDADLVHHVLRRRLCAFVVDGLIVSVLCAVAWTLLLAFGLLTLGLGMPLLGLVPLVPLLYNWLTLTAYGATPGQSLLGLAVRRDADLGRPTSLEALVWTIGFIVTVSLGAIWFALALLTTRKRTPHDLVSGLTVVRERALDQALTVRSAVWNAAPGGTSYV